MSRIVSVTQKAAAGAKRIFDILDHVSSVPEPTHPVHLEQVSGAIELRDVCFRYGTRNILQRCESNHRAGRDDRPGRPQRIGQEHAGQPDLPLLRRGGRLDPHRRRGHPLAAGFRIPAQHRPGAAGAVPVFRHDRRKHRLRQTRTRLARKSSPRPARPTPTSSSCACRRATTRWSASAARPCPAASASGSRSPAPCSSIRRILILDEATSSVDTETELEIQGALDNLIRGRTTLAIAHRLSTLRRADRLVVLDRGEVVEEGQSRGTARQKGRVLPPRPGADGILQRRSRSADAERTMRRCRHAHPQGDLTTMTGDFQLHRNPFGQLVFTGAGRRRHTWTSSPRGPFPITAPRRRHRPAGPRRPRTGVDSQPRRTAGGNPPLGRGGTRKPASSCRKSAGSAASPAMPRPAPGRSRPTAATPVWCSRPRRTSAA